jgi:hypothetical protein
MLILLPPLPYNKPCTLAYLAGIPCKAKDCQIYQKKGNIAQRSGCTSDKIVPIGTESC